MIRDTSLTLRSAVAMHPLELLQFRQSFFDFAEVRQFLGTWRLLAVLNDAAFVDDKGRARRGVADAGKHWTADLVLPDNFLVQIAGAGDVDCCFLRPALLG